MKLVLWSFLTLAVTCGGCGDIAWYRPNTTLETAKADCLSCFAETDNYYYFGDSRYYASKIFQQCMIRKGYGVYNVTDDVKNGTLRISEKYKAEPSALDPLPIDPISPTSRVAGK